MVPTRPAAPEMVPRLAGVGEAPSPDGRVLSDLVSRGFFVYGAVAALRSSACGLARRSVRYTYVRHLFKSELSWTARPCFVDAAF